MDQLIIPVLLGTGRDGRRSEPVAKYLHARLIALGVTSELIDVRDISNPVTHGPSQPTDRTAHWRELMAGADGLLVVTPEYNRGYPGELKIAIDALEKEYKHKAVAIAGVSSGPFGGTRVIQQLRQVFVYLGATCVGYEMNFGSAKALFDESGALLDPTVGERQTAALEELLWQARALKAARAADASKA